MTGRPSIVARLRGTFAPYLAISVVALLADVAVLSALSGAAGVRPSLAAFAAWWVGLAVHYHLARAMLYTAMPRGGSWAQGGGRLLVYAGPSIVGLAITVAVVEAGTMLHAPLLLSKAIAAALSFQLAFVLRSLMYARPKAA